uniref:Uncharacterized protein n=1 Tax=Bracon brevicornis TaxID=1563983 RepID=A0A6V7L0R1_9HYME
MDFSMDSNETDENQPDYRLETIAQNPTLSYTYDVNGCMRIKVSNEALTRHKLHNLAFITMSADIGITFPEWSFLAPHIFSSFRKLVRMDDWRHKRKHYYVSQVFYLDGRVIAPESKENLPKLLHDMSYKGCVAKSQVILDYEAKLHFSPQPEAAHKLLDTHGWRTETEKMTDNEGLEMLNKVLEYHKNKSRLDHEIAWKMASGNELLYN